MDTEGF